jgi:hypothetical protein
MPLDISDEVLAMRKKHAQLDEMADSSYMLGLNRDEITLNGVKTIQVTQEAYITELYEAFGVKLFKCTPALDCTAITFLFLKYTPALPPDLDSGQKSRFHIQSS